MSQPYNRVFNFSAGPCTLPVEVLKVARDGLMNWNGTGMSVMELSHRSSHFEGILADTEAAFRRVFHVPSNYKVVFLQGGASLQNTMIPMNLRGEGRTAAYVVTGTWGKKSYQDAKIGGATHLAFDGKEHGYSNVPDLGSLDYGDNPSYIHWTSNETIQGVEFQGDATLPALSVCDMSSNILSRPCDVSKYGLIYAGAQKNMGPSGVAVVVIREDLLPEMNQGLPPMLDYRTQVENGSMYNTPPCWGIYMCGLNYQWVERQGGLEAMQTRNREKAQVLYDAIDQSGGFYRGHADKACRSIMNVTFTLADASLTDAFVQGAEAEKLDGLKGHRSVGGVRASIYNAFPNEGCETLAAYMKSFAASNG
ncbi:MAG: 3-phosphoserine/phosphohydroxythreonine transaminase [Fimbriimonadaceae bacterium]|nr:3-phosphoserine/phosphohydroxythreonine transaminase [Fimbriimonadaceae bacterium]